MNNSRSFLLGVFLITSYEKIFGFLLILTGFIYILTPTTEFGGQNGTQGMVIKPLYVYSLGSILICLGIIGITGSIMFWKKYGYQLNLIFLTLTGILLFMFFLIPTVVLIFSLIYFIKDKDFRNTKNLFLNS